LFTPPTRLLALESAGLGDWQREPGSGELRWSARVRELLRVGPDASPDFALGRYHPDDRAEALRILNGPALPEGAATEVEFRVASPGQEQACVHGWVRTVRVSRPGAPPGALPVPLVVGVLVDVTPWRRAERVLERRVAVRDRLLRRYARALTLAEQEERRRIAHVLHDDLQQVLAAARTMAGLERPGDGDPVAWDPDGVAALLDRAMRITRSLSHELAPPLLDGDGLEGVLEWVAEKASEWHGLAVELEVSGPLGPVAPAVGALLYRLVRELLFNVAKHAGTPRARVVAEQNGGRLRITVADEGAGFDPARADQRSGGLGLVGARERLEALGGRMHVASEKGKGTRVTLEVALE
jgi:signal transduction histidine kinase